MKRSDSAARDAERRRVIIDAARICFLRYGYAKTSFDDIAKQADLSRPLLYRKFANKEAIYGAVYDDLYESKYPRVEAILAGPGSRKDKLTQVCEALVLEPWAVMLSSPGAQEFYDACLRVVPDLHAKHERKALAIVKQLIGERDVAETFLLALGGLFEDLPSLAVARKRVAIVIQRFGTS